MKGEKKKRGSYRSDRVTVKACAAVVPHPLRFDPASACSVGKSGGLMGVYFIILSYYCLRGLTQNTSAQLTQTGQAVTLCSVKGIVKEENFAVNIVLGADLLLTAYSLKIVSPFLNEGE